MTSLLKQKLDAKGRYRIRKEQITNPIRIMVRTERNLSKEQEIMIEEAGYHYRILVDNLLTGHIANVEQLEKLAALPFVRQIEVSAPLYGE